MADEVPALGDFPVVIELPVLWGDMDAFQHVNNVMYFRYFESARIAYADRISLYRYQQDTGTGPILAATSCNFIKPLRYPDTICVGCRTIHLTESEIHQEHAIYSRQLKRVAATGTAVIVAYDYRRLRRSVFAQPPLDCILKLEKGLQLSTA
jgi:acyl-CoA thioester hydrolase